MDNKTELEKLTAQREHAVTRIFWFGFEIALVFGIPAGLGAWIGTKLGGGIALALILGFTFILSWTIIIFRYKQISKKMSGLDTRIKELKNQLEDK
jgi:predicted MFS family arabinose efflux permease